MKATRVAGLALSAVAVGVLTAGCSGGTPGSSEGTTIPPTRAGSTTVPYVAAKNARADVSTDGGCSRAADGSWTLRGSAINPTATRHGFTIVVDFITVPGDTVLHTSVVSLSGVASHASATWSAQWSEQSSTALTCVIRQAQFS